MTYIIEEIKEMLEKISPWPWIQTDENEAVDSIPLEKTDGKDFRICIVGEDLVADEYESNLKFIAAAPQIISDLVNKFEEQQKEIKELKEYKQMYLGLCK